MFGNILIGVDGRQGGRDAIALARQLAAPEASLTLAHICAISFGRGAGAAISADRAAGRELLERERELTGVDAELVVLVDRATGLGLHEIAQQRRADLLVVGSTRHALVGRILAGDDCRAALTGAQCPVAVAPRGYAPAAPHPLRLGVGYDASPESERALGAARDLAASHGGDITVFWVVSPEDVRTEKPIPADWPAATGALIDRRSEQLSRLADVRAVVRAGGPREQLATASADLDLLIVGTRGNGRLDRMLHGSVAHYLLGHVGCPLLVLPHAAEARASASEADPREHETGVESRA